VKAGRNEACPCGSGKKVKRCCGVDVARRSDDAAAELFGLAFHFPRYRPATPAFDAWAETASEDLDRATVADGVACLDRQERDRIAGGLAREYPDVWASVVADLGDEKLAVTLVLGGAVVAGIKERHRAPDAEALTVLEREGAARADPVEALALALDATDLWSVIESEQAAAALEAAGFGGARAALAAEADRLSGTWHRERLHVMVARLRACLPDPAHPLASVALRRACDATDTDRKLARRLLVELLLDSLPRLLAEAA
jgi:hypothetical protein